MRVFTRGRSIRYHPLDFTRAARVLDHRQNAGPILTSLPGYYIQLGQAEFAGVARVKRSGRAHQRPVDSRNVTIRYS